MKYVRSRYGGRKDDRFDAFVLADVLRADFPLPFPVNAVPIEAARRRAVCRRAVTVIGLCHMRHLGLRYCQRRLTRSYGQHGISCLTWAFTGWARVEFWLRQGQRDRGADELEGLPLGAGRLGEHRDGDPGSGEPDLVAGQGGQVLQQAAEAPVGLPGWIVLIGRLGLGGRRAARRGYVERDFRHIKADDLDLRPLFHRLEERVRAHVLICMLACYLTWHLRRAWAR